MRRKGETFAEFLTAATVFGLIAASMFEFMANQTQTLANIRDRDNLIYHAGRFMAISRDVTPPVQITQAGISFDLNNDKSILTVTNNNASITFSLKPTTTTP